jgi:hypothetical protein
VERSKVVIDENDNDAAGGIGIIALDAGNTTKECPQSFYWSVTWHQNQAQHV